MTLQMPLWTLIPGVMVGSCLIWFIENTNSRGRILPLTISGLISFNLLFAFIVLAIIFVFKINFRKRFKE